MAFDVFRQLDLNFLGDNWKGCYIKFRYISLAEAKGFAELGFDKDDPKSVQQALDKTVEVLKEKFVEGKAMADGQMVDLKKEQLAELPTDVLNKAILLLTGSLDEDKKKE